MARLTKGCAFAFQVLGYLTYQSANHRYQEILPAHRQYLDDFVYDKRKTLSIKLRKSV